jgi:O-antigen/teichoic acid export membrane protein
MYASSIIQIQVDVRGIRSSIPTTHRGPQVTAVSPRLEALTNDRLLRRNVVLNLAGWALPAAAALVSIPLLAKGLGAARFGLVALTWAAIGLFSIFDFGLGRVLTRLVADRLAAGHEEDLGDLVWSASWMLLGLTSLLAVIGVVIAPVLAARVLHVPPELRHEATGVLQLLAIAIPPLAHGVALRGVLEAGQRFGRVNQLRIPLGVASYAGPLLAIPLGADARIAVGIIVLSRIVYWLGHVPFLADIAPGISRPRAPKRAAVRELTQIGGWITVSNVVSPVIVSGDRIVVALALPIQASGWYGAAAEVATKQWLFSAALGPVLFAALSAALKTAPQRAAELAERAARITLLTLLPVVMVLAAFAEPGLKLWLGNAAGAEAGPVLRWLAIAVYVNAIAHAPYFLLQSGVDARAVAVVHLIELPLYFAALVGAAWRFGVQGIALVWLARMAIDCAILWAIVHHKMPEARDAVIRVARLSLACLSAIGMAALWGATRAW